MTNKAIDELIATLRQIGADLHETKLRVEAMDAALKATSPQTYHDYLQKLKAYREANQVRSMVLASGEAYDRLRSALILDQIPQKN